MPVPTEVAPPPSAPSLAPARSAAAPKPIATPTETEEEGRVEIAVGRGEAVTFDFTAMLTEFQRGIESQISGDAQSHYDLGMAYREMGLLSQAVDSFRLAARDPAFRSRCTEMMGRCMLEEGRFEDAVGEFAAAIASGDLDAESEMSMRYQLGLALEAAGRAGEALSEFEQVFVSDANYADVAGKIRALRKSLESS
jgi:tetratricopeptide (TPR) repeat protein